MVDYKSVSEKLLETLNEILSNIVEMDCDPTEALLLASGNHEIVVKTGFPPTKVFVSVTDEGVQACGGDLSNAATSLQEDGFILYANIKSDNATVKWIVKA